MNEALLTEILEFLNNHSVASLITLIALLATVLKVNRFLKNRAFTLSKKRAHDDTVEMISENKSKDSTQSEDARSLDKWIERIRDGDVRKN